MQPEPEAIPPEAGPRPAARSLAVVAAAAAFTVGVHPYLLAFLQSPVFFLPFGYWRQAAYSLLAAATTWTIILVAVPAAGGVREIRRVGRLYGFAAAYASMAAMAWSLLDEAATRVVGCARAGRFPSGPLVEALWREVFPYSRTTWYSPLIRKVVVDGVAVRGIAVLGAWTVLAVGGLGARPTGWLDRIGVLLGVLAIVGSLIHHVEPFLPNL